MLYCRNDHMWMST
uniref:Uncharacterized protein n=1 Tax=Arundo donax TaxID=35708 RepID=A0A0A8Y7W9_ARUDO